VKKQFRFESITPGRKKILTFIVVILIGILAFFLFSTYRQRYVGACDWYSYLQQAVLLRSGHLYLETELNPRVFPAAAPLGYYTRNDKIVAQFPPGYPVLMALLGFFNLESYVTPLLGMLSFFLIFLIIKEFTNQSTALMFSILWILFPLTVWGSVYMMSDLPACFFLLLCYYLLMKGKIPLSGLLFGFSLLIRPSNIILAFALLPLLIRKKKLFTFGLYAAITGSLMLAYNWHIHGAPWKYAFFDTSSLFSGSIFFSNILYYLKGILTQFTPILLFLALYALWKKRKDVNVYFHGIWFISFVIFYSFIIFSGHDAWWENRYILPAYPALFILAALGVKEITDNAIKNWQKAVPFIKPVMVVCTMLLAAYFLYFESKTLLFNKDKVKRFYQYAVEVANHVPPDSFVGSYETSGALRLYGNLESFNILHGNCIKLINRMLGRKRPVYLVYEPHLKDSWFYQKHVHLYDLVKIMKLSAYRDYYLLRIRKKRIRMKIRMISAPPGGFSPEHLPQE
jgi:hypothetical protein